MCGITALLNILGNKEELRKQILKMSKRIRHRGPDWSGIWTGERAIIAHERLAIVDPLSGKQPLKSRDGKNILGVNGEIYNHLDIRKSTNYDFMTGSDCEVILSLYRDKGTDFIEELSGIFAFVLYDSEKDLFIIARDPIGVIPLYIGVKDKTIMVASELKALEGFCLLFEEFQPGHILIGSPELLAKDAKFQAGGIPTTQKWYTRDWFSFDAVKNNPIDVQGLKNALCDAVKRQMMSDVPYGVLLSGGLDSSITSAVAQMYSKERAAEAKNEAWFPNLHSFAVGLPGSPDLIAAKKAAEAIGTIHHEIYFTVQEGLDAIPDVIYHLETYDVTTVRAATPMYLMARVIKSLGIKMVLSGEGSDEIFAGYLYFHKAPTPEALHEECVRKVSKLHLYDCLRANKSMAAWGVECRVPFLDKEFLDVAMRTNPASKMSGNCMEKKILREAFDDMLPKEICWRQKEQFSDGVGYSWIDTLKATAASLVSDEDFAKRAEKFPINTPLNKEEYHYRSIFQDHFPSESAAKCVPSVPSVACSTAEALAWDESFKKMNEPSGRSIMDVHVSFSKDDK